MSILRSIFQAIKGGASEAGEAIVDSNLIRILEQDIRDDGKAINNAKQSLSNLKSTEYNLLPIKGNDHLPIYGLFNITQTPII